MTRYTSDSRDRVFDAVDMVSLVSSRTELRRHGVNSYFGLCPFHDERTPSFHVSPDEKLYHCFGCQASGNAFTFVMETEGVDFSAALEMLAKRFSVQLQTEREDPQAQARRTARERLYTLMERAPPITPGIYGRPASPLRRANTSWGGGFPNRSSASSGSVSRPARGTGSSSPLAARASQMTS